MAEREVKVIIRADDRSKSALGSATRGFQRLNKTVLGVAGSVLKAFTKIGIAAGLAFGAFAALSVKTAIEVESAFAGVIKTTDGLVDEFGDLTKAGEGLKQEFRELALEIPTDLPELMRLGEVGGQLGIARENLAAFTETMAAMGVATDLTGEQAAVAFARIANVMQTSQEDFDRMGSSVVALGNTFATNEPAIVDFAQRIAAAGEIAGLTEADVFGMAAAFSAVGVNAEAGGTAVQKVLIAMTRSVAEGGDQLDIFAATAGLSAEQFAIAFEEDAAGAFTAFVRGLGEQGDDAFGTLKDLELQDQRLIRAFLSLAGAGDLLGETIEVSNLAWDENTALAKEAEQRYGTLESQFQIVKNVVKDVGLSFGEALTPFIRDALKAALPFIKEFAQNLPAFLEERLIPALKTIVTNLGIVVTAISDFVKDLQAGKPLMAAFSDALRGLVPDATRIKILEIAQAIKDFVDAASIFVREHAPALKAAFIGIGAAIAAAAIAAAIAGIVAAINPIGLIIGAIALAIGAFAAAWETNWGGIRDKMEAIWAFLQPIFDTIRLWLAEKIPIAVEALTNVWNNTLLPVLTAVWEFMRDAVIPLFVKLAEVGIVVLTKAVEFLVAIWEKLTPIFETVWNFIKTKLTPSFQTFSGVLTSIKTAIKTLIDWLDKLIKKITSIKLPDFLKSGSLGALSIAGPGGLTLPSAMFAQGAGAAPSGPTSLSTGARIHIENLNVTGSGAAGADVRNVVTMLEFGTRTV